MPAYSNISLQYRRLIDAELENAQSLKDLFRIGNEYFLLENEKLSMLERGAIIRRLKKSEVKPLQP